jgi:hypothetical protein
MTALLTEPQSVVSEPFSLAGEYLAAGWSPLWFAPRTKFPPPAGFTGSTSPDPSPEDIAGWMAEPGGNIGIRLPENVVGIDVDDYGAKIGGFTLADLEDRLGSLPDTAISSSHKWDSVLPCASWTQVAQ